MVARDRFDTHVAMISSRHLSVTMSAAVHDAATLNGEQARAAVLLKHLRVRCLWRNSFSAEDDVCHVMKENPHRSHGADRRRSALQETCSEAAERGVASEFRQVLRPLPQYHPAASSHV